MTVRKCASHWQYFDELMLHNYSRNSQQVCLLTLLKRLFFLMKQFATSNFYSTTGKKKHSSCKKITCSQKHKATVQWYIHTTNIILLLVFMRDKAKRHDAHAQQQQQQLIKQLCDQIIFWSKHATHVLMIFTLTTDNSCNLSSELPWANFSAICNAYLQ